MLMGTVTGLLVSALKILSFATPMMWRSAQASFIIGCCCMVSGLRVVLLLTPQGCEVKAVT